MPCKYCYFLTVSAISLEQAELYIFMSWELRCMLFIIWIQKGTVKKILKVGQKGQIS